MKARIIIYVLYHERLHSCTDWRAGSRAGSFTPCRAGRPAAFPSRWTSRPAAFPPCRANRPDAHNFVQIRRFPVFARNPSAQIRISALLQESLCVICIFLLANFQFKAFCKKSFLQAPPALPPRRARQAASGIRPPRAGLAAPALSHHAKHSRHASQANRVWHSPAACRLATPALSHHAKHSRHASQASLATPEKRSGRSSPRQPLRGASASLYTIGCCTAEIITVLSCTLRPPACSS